MLPRERIARAMRLEKPDRVPVMCGPSIGFLLVINPDIDPLEMWHDQTVYAEALERMVRRFEFDGALTAMLGNCPLDTQAVERIDRGNPEGPMVTYKNGDKTVYCRNDLPRHRYACKPTADFEAFDPESIPETVSYLPVSNDLNIQIASDPAERVRVITELRRRLGNTYSVHGEVYAPMDYFIELFGLEEAMTALLIHPEKSREIHLRFAHAIGQHAREQIDAGADAVVLSSPWTGQGFLSLDTYKTVVAPAQAMLAEACHERNTPMYCHTCGAIDDRLEMMVDSGMHGLECLDPPPLGNVRLEEAIARIGDRAFIKGNIDPVHVLCNGTPEQIEADVRHRITVGMQAKGFILSTACSIAPATPPEHVAMLAPLACQFGEHGEFARTTLHESGDNL